jgi:2'-5' RNA ligase
MPRGQPPEQLSLGPELSVLPTRLFFFAIRPVTTAIAHISGLNGRLRRDGLMLGRPVDADRLHLTLYPLGAFADQVPPDLVQTASMAAGTIGKDSFEVTFNRIGGRGRLLLRSSDRLTALRELQQSLSNVLARVGLSRGAERAFSPHITLSYDFCDVSERELDPVSWPVTQFVLIESLLGKHKHIERGVWDIQH